MKYDKLVCIDVDGTLVHGEYKVTNEIKKALDNCHAKKVIVSGRTVEELLKLNLDYDLIGSNGGEIYSKGKYIRKLNIPKVEALNLIDEVNKLGYYIIVPTDTEVVIQEDSKVQVSIELEKMLKKYNLDKNEYKDRFEHMYNHIYQRCMKVDNLKQYIQDNNLHINKLESHFELDKSEFFTYLNNNYNVESFNSAGSNIEIVPKGALKGNAILEYIKDDKYHIISIGDGDNDIPMFEISDLKIAMGNGSTNLKNLADLIVKPKQAGFIEALEIINNL